MSDERIDFKQPVWTVRVGEVRQWSFDITRWAASGSAPVVSAARTDTEASVTATIFGAGAATLVGTTYTLPPAGGWDLAVGEYRITCQFASGSQVLRPAFLVRVVR